MNDDSKSCCAGADNEPTVTRSPAPMWIIVVTLCLLFFGGLFLDSQSGWFNDKIYRPYSGAEQLESYQPKSGEAAALAMGKVRYENTCGICHGNDGAGKPGQAPEIAGSEWVVTKGFNRLAYIPLAGLTGPIQVRGKDWNMSMAAMGAALSDEELAAVLTYIRSSWGNKASPVTAEDIARIRAAVGKNPQPLTGAQILQIPE